MTTNVVRFSDAKSISNPKRLKRLKPLKYRDPDLDELLPLIERHMVANKLTVQQLATKADSSTSMLYDWLNHVTRHPSHVKMATVARAIGMEYRLVRRD